MAIANGEAPGGLIRSARRAAGLSQEQPARKAECSTAYVRLIESGYKPEHGEAFERVRRAAGCVPSSDLRNAVSQAEEPGSRTTLGYAGAESRGRTPA